MIATQLSPILEARALMLTSGVRTDSKMFNLPMETFETLVSLVFCERLAPKVALAMVEKEGMPKAKLPGLSAFYQWQRDFLPFYSACSRKAAVRTANEVAEEAKRSPGEWNQAIADKLSQATFELLSDPNRDPKAVKNFVTGVLNFGKLDVQREQLAQAERKLKLLETERAKVAKQLEAAQAPNATDADRKAVVAKVWEMLGAGKPPEA
ncbi:MAG: hypothetical protein EBS68_10345 [Rhodobacteraceae bacterium]|nr:hypothetical protein [Paracoccaceae bacterium]